MKANVLANNRIDVKLFFKNGPAIKVPRPKKKTKKKKKPSNKGKPISAVGIKNLKFSSNVKE